MEDLKIIYEDFKRSVCDLTQCKVRKNYIEIITSNSTLNNKFVSVFIFKKDNKYIISDFGWFGQNYYDTPFYEESENIIKKLIDSYLHTYEVKTVVDSRSNLIYYKSTESIKSVPSLVYDLTQFITGIINGHCIQFQDIKEEKQRETFRKEVDQFLRNLYGQSLKTRKPLDDLSSVKFNAIVEKQSRINLITYVSGSSQYYFENDLRKTIINFELSKKSKYDKFIDEKITIINDLSNEFEMSKAPELMNMLDTKVTKPPVLWSDKRKISEYI